MHMTDRLELIIAADVFGRTPELEALAKTLAPYSSRATLVDPYNGACLEFAHEREAYTYFHQNVGLKRYRETLRAVLAGSVSPLLLVGFSVGASAIWSISDAILRPHVTAAVGFYGSQIRHYTNVKPRIRMELLFPYHEPHFDVGHLISQLSPRENVVCYCVPYLHGFMNRKSDKFDASAYHNHLLLLKERLARPGRPGAA